MKRVRRADVVAAMLAWFERHGRMPMWDDWQHAAPGRPCAKTVERRWGWERLRAQALGVSRQGIREMRARAHPDGLGSRWREQALIEALIHHRRDHGEWPSGNAWEAATATHPARRTYVRRFGSWDAAVAAAERARRAGAGQRRRSGTRG